jgi:hypothetical protein
MSQRCQEGHSARPLLYISELMATQNCAARRLAARDGIASKTSGGEAIEAFPLSRRAMLDFFRGCDSSSEISHPDEDR